MARFYTRTIAHFVARTSACYNARWRRRYPRESAGGPPMALPVYVGVVMVAAAVVEVQVQVQVQVVVVVERVALETERFRQ